MHTSTNESIRVGEKSTVILNEETSNVCQTFENIRKDSVQCSKLWHTSDHILRVPCPSQRHEVEKIVH